MSDQLLTEIRDLLILLVKQGAATHGCLWATEDEDRALITEDLTAAYRLANDDPEALASMATSHPDLFNPFTGQLHPIAVAVEARLRARRAQTQGYR